MKIRNYLLEKVILTVRDFPQGNTVSKKLNWVPKIILENGISKLL